MPIFTSKRDQSNITLFFAIQGLVTLLLLVATYSVISQNQFLSLAMAQVLVWFSLLSFAIFAYLFFLKKNVALLVGVIVFKWPILIWLVYKMTGLISISPVFFALGFMSPIIGAIIWSFLQKE